MELKLKLNTVEGWMALLLIFIVFSGIIGIIVGFAITLTGTSSFFEQYIPMNTLIIGIAIYLALALIVSVYIKFKKNKSKK